MSEDLSIDDKEKRPGAGLDHSPAEEQGASLELQGIGEPVQGIPKSIFQSG